MRTGLILYFVVMIMASPAQEIRRISKATEDIQLRSKEYANAIRSSHNSLTTEVAYKDKDSSIFLKEIDAFFVAFEKNLVEDNHSVGFTGKSRKMNYVLFISNAGYIDAFYYDFEDGKLKLSFMGALNSFIANYKWDNSKRAKITHQGSYNFK